ncbi:MAG: S1 family peptidase [Calditrichia bacterium]
MINIEKILSALRKIMDQISTIQDELKTNDLANRDSELEYNVETGFVDSSSASPVVHPILYNEEVVGGETTSEFADCCAVGNDENFYCSGTLIAPNMVVTAQHCYGITRVFIGGNDIFRTNEGEVIRVLESFESRDVDLRILILERPSKIIPRSIAIGNEIDNIRIGLVVGFGNVNPRGTIGYGIKRMAEVPIMSTDGSDNTDNRYGFLEGKEFVAGHLGLMRDSCKGDSGGPLYIQGANNQYYLLGATSRGTRSGNNPCGDGGIYVRIDVQIDWIERVTGIKPTTVEYIS